MESGHQLATFASELVSHPIDIGNNVCRAFTSLAKLALSQEWATLSQSLAPEVCQLVNEWNLLSSQRQGERSGYIVAKYGGDILIPGAAAKVLSKGIEGAKEIALAAKNLETAEQTLALEALSQSARSSTAFAEMSTQLSTESEKIVITTKGEKFLRENGLWESFQKCRRAEKFLEPFQGQYLPEIRVRDLIHEAGMPTFPRPQGIPNNFRITFSDKGAGMKYVHPNDEGTYVRVMPGKSHSQFPHQQKPYVVRMKNGQNLDKLGNNVSQGAIEAHIPLDEFFYIE